MLKAQDGRSGLIGAICAGPKALISHKIGEGKMVTSYPTFQSKFEEAGTSKQFLKALDCMPSNETYFFYYYIVAMTAERCEFKIHFSFQHLAAYMQLFEALANEILYYQTKSVTV